MRPSTNGNWNTELGSSDRTASIGKLNKIAQSNSVIEPSCATSYSKLVNIDLRTSPDQPGSRLAVLINKRGLL